MSQTHIRGLQSTQSGLYCSSSKKTSKAVVSITGKVDRETVHGEVAESPEKALGVCGERERTGGAGRSAGRAGSGWI